MQKKYEKKGLEDIISLVARLRGREGCPWDREQDGQSLKKYLIEETYEVIEAIDSKKPDNIKEELGDLLYQILFHARIAEEDGHFDIYDVITSIYNKMVRRHPHVFAGEQVKDSREVLKRWEMIKGDERKEGEDRRKSILEGVPKELPSLLRAYRLQCKAARVGFDFPNIEEAISKLKEEQEEFYSALSEGNKEGLSEEAGDIFFVLANICRLLDIDPEAALQKSNIKFINRFLFIERELSKEGKRPEDATLDNMETLWNRAKFKY